MSRILATLGAAALPHAAFAHTGHIANVGQGHDQWLVHGIAVAIALGLTAWAVTRFAARTVVRKRSQS